MIFWGGPHGYSEKRTQSLEAHNCLEASVADLNKDGYLDIAMTSIDEARMYTGRQTHEEVADFFLSHGARIAVVKLGGEGLFVKSADEAHLLPPHKVKVVDTTGAGDAACGGFLHGYIQGWDLQKCARLANAVGGLTVQHMGGAEAIRTLDETLAFMETG